MISLLKADLYKELKKKSFKYLVMLIIFVSVLSLIVFNKNVNLEKKYNEIYPLFSEEEYYNVNKYGSYEHYKNNYESYKDVVNTENRIIEKNSLTNIKYILSYSQNFVFVLGVLIIFLSFHSFSYDYQKDSLKYVFQNKYGRSKVYFSKLLSLMLITLILFVILLITMLITSALLTHENIFLIKEFVLMNGKIKEISLFLLFLKASFCLLFPLFFVIVMSMFFSILFKGNSFGLVCMILIYFGSLVISQILFGFGFTFLEYTFLPYIDFTYLINKSDVAFNNLVYSINISNTNSYSVLGFYSLVFIFMSIKFLKRDV